MAAEGTSSKNIAEQCCISDIRVRMCLTGIYKKLGLTDKKNKRAALAKILLPR
ncbi:MAG: LuxR C-terminal-related transcriptional regulator [Chitinispirillia bacterium]|nr:LuxR C-terminal-related transcriptional regulator [Chitinispirillia bacterium]MCL2268326.1 LuxR C-terminal-related transcriptional regulator [Chitinispirillia bacterium]